MTNKEKALATYEILQERKKKRTRKAQKEADTIAIESVKRHKNKRAKNYGKY